MMDIVDHHEPQCVFQGIFRGNNDKVAGHPVPYRRRRNAGMPDAAYVAYRDNTGKAAFFEDGVSGMGGLLYQGADGVYGSIGRQGDQIVPGNHGLAYQDPVEDPLLYSCRWASDCALVCTCSR